MSGAKQTAETGGFRIDRADVAALALFAALSLFFLLPGHSISREVFGPGGDPQTFVWYMHWWPYALRHGLNPFVTDKIWHVTGYNLTWSTSIPFLSLSMAPVTWMFGAIVSYNLLCLASPAVSAWTAYLLFRNVSGKILPALLGGWIFGFSSYEIAALDGHINLAFVPFVPLSVILCKLRVDRALSRRRFVVLLALTVGCQIGTSLEVTLTLAFFGLLFWSLLVALVARSRPVLLGLAAEVAISGVLVGAALSPFFYFFAKGFAEIPDQLNSPLVFSTDVTNFIIPTAHARFGGRLFRSFSAQFTGNLSEQGAYIGLPLALIAATAIRAHVGDRAVLPHPHRRAILALGLLTLMICVATLGPRLHAGQILSFHLPWALLSGLPVVNSVLPCRFSLYLALCVACLVVLHLASPAPSRSRVVVAVLAAALLIPTRSQLVWWPWPVDPFFTTDSVHRMLGASPTVLILPFAANGPGMAWQLDAGLSFSQSAGYGAGYVPQSEPRDVFAALRTGTPPERFADALAAHCALHDVGFVLVGPGTPPAVRHGVAAMGWPVTTSGDVDVFRVPPRASLRYVTVQGDYWPGDEPAGWMGKQVRVATHGKPAHVRLSTLLRPAQAGTEEMTVTQSGRTTHIALAPGRVMDIDIPADSDAIIRADTVFKPSETMGSADERGLSVLLTVTDS